MIHYLIQELQLRCLNERPRTCLIFSMNFIINYKMNEDKIVKLAGILFLLRCLYTNNVLHCISHCGPPLWCFLRSMNVLSCFTCSCTLTTNNTRSFWHLCRIKKVMRYAVIRRTSWGNAHPWKTKSILAPRGPNCLLQGAKSLWSCGLWRKCNFSQDWDVGPWFTMALRYLTCIDITGVNKHLSIFEVVGFNSYVKNAVLSYAAAWLPFLCCFPYLDITMLFFSTVWKFWLLACALHMYVQNNFIEQFSFLALTCQLSIHRSLTTWMRENSIFSLWCCVATKTRVASHVIPVKRIRHRRQNRVLTVSAKHLYPVFCSQILCVMWKNVH